MAKHIDDIYQTCQTCYEIRKIVTNNPKPTCSRCQGRKRTKFILSKHFSDNSIFIAQVERANKIKAMLKAMIAGLSDAEIAMRFNCSRQYAHRVRRNNLIKLAGYADCGSWKKRLKELKDLGSRE
jgi:hypothetical protein